MKNYLQKSEIVKNAMEDLKRMYPWTKDVKINLEKNSKGQYRSKIRLIYQNKLLFAHKMGLTAQDALSKTFKALFHRLEKLKGERRRWVLKEGGQI